MAETEEKDLTDEEFGVAVGAEPGSLTEEQGPLLKTYPGARMLSYKRDGQEYIVGFGPNTRLWMWGRHPQDQRSPLLAASTLRLMAAYIELLERRVARGLEKFIDSSEEILDAVERQLGNPDVVREMFGQTNDPDEVVISAAGVARLTVERVREARAARASREKMH